MTRTVEAVSLIEFFHLVWRRLLGNRKRDCHGGALPSSRAYRRNRAADSAHKGLGNPQTQTGTGNRRGMARAPEKPFAEACLFVLGEALAPIRDRYRDVVIMLLHRQPDGGAAGGIFHGIVQNLSNRLLQQYRIDMHERHIV